MRHSEQRLRVPTFAAVLLLCAACASSPPRSKSRPQPPPVPPSTAAGDAMAADAVPRAEPRSSHGNPPFYDVNGHRYQLLARAEGFTERGVASWYGPDFQGHNTSSGERYDMYGMSAAHRTLPIPCFARITNLVNGRSIVVRINDRGPFVANRIVDLSYSAALRLDIVRTGTAFVELRVVGPEPEGTSAQHSSAQHISARAATAPNPLPAAAMYIQIGAFADEHNAQRTIDRLQGAGVAPVLSLTSTAEGGRRVLRRVRVGPIATVAQFDALAARLAGLGYPDAQLASD